MTKVLSQNGLTELIQLSKNEFLPKSNVVSASTISTVNIVQSVNNVSPISGNVTLSIPSDTSDLTNGAGYITSSALSGYQTTANLVTSVSSSSTDNQYPSALCLYTLLGDVESLINAL